MTTSRIYAYRWPARLVSHKPFAAERYFITSSCIWQVFFRDFSEKIRFFFFIFFFRPPGSNFVQNAQFPEPPSGGKPEPPFQDAPKKLLLYKNSLRHRCAMPPLPKGEVLETNLSVCFADSSPNRGATGETVLAVLDEQSSSFPETAGLRCRDSRLLAQHPLLERSSAATANEDRARCFALHRTQANSRAGPACQGLPYQGSWREAPERLYRNRPSPSSLCFD